MHSVEWAAGLFEGEGCIFYKTYGKHLHKRLSLTMTDQDVVEKFAAVFGWKVTPTKGTVKPAWAARTGKTSSIISALEQMLPYFGNRRACKALNLLDELELKS
jgi:hypothetical protein